MANIQISQLTREITKALEEYTTEVEEGLEKAKKKIVRDGVRQLKADSPKDSGVYASGWRSTQQDGAQVVHNATKPQLTHLLEKGHAKRGGGRVGGEVHIKPVEQKMIQDFESEVERVIRR